MDPEAGDIVDEENPFANIDLVDERPTKQRGPKKTYEEVRNTSLQYWRRKRKQAKEGYKKKKNSFQTREEYLASEFGSKCHRRHQLRKYWKFTPIEQITFHNPIVMIDCSFEQEIRSLTAQLMHAYGYLKQHERPVKLIVASYGPIIESRLHHLEAFNWKIFFDKRDISEMTELDMSKMIYLSPDSPNELETISHDDIYIIGGIVDDNRLFGLSMERAEKLGIRTACLPLRQYASQYSLQSLNVNHVFNIIMDVANGADWITALRAHIPQRYDMSDEKNPSKWAFSQNWEKKGSSDTTEESESTVSSSDEDDNTEKPQPT